MFLIFVIFSLFAFVMPFSSNIPLLVNHFYFFAYYPFNSSQTAVYNNLKASFSCYFSHQTNALKIFTNLLPIILDPNFITFVFVFDNRFREVKKPLVQTSFSPNQVKFTVENHLPVIS